MKYTIVNPEDISDDLPVGSYCMRVDSVSASRLEINLRFTGQLHIGNTNACCLIQMDKHPETPQEGQRDGKERGNPGPY